MPRGKCGSSWVGPSQLDFWQARERIPPLPKPLEHALSLFSVLRYVGNLEVIWRGIWNCGIQISIHRQMRRGGSAGFIFIPVGCYLLCLITLWAKNPIISPPPAHKEAALLQQKSWIHPCRYSLFYKVLWCTYHCSALVIFKNNNSTCFSRSEEQKWLNLKEHRQNTFLLSSVGTTWTER